MKQKIVLAYLWYLRNLAKLQLLKNKPLIIGITGSAGKTSTLNAVEAVLKYQKKITKKRKIIKEFLN